MASLDKLAVRGIRSFDDKHVQVIQFYSPLTVIVGHNGSGKTTIIECLKYATTGDLPPNTRGGAFVHDPKIANEKEVKAQVRLRFWNVNRQRMTATRNLQVSVSKKKGGPLSMKTLEGILAKSDEADGKRNTISTKCAEMDEEVPLLLGVSKSILENVIFCHQEESNWPFSEPGTLKKKFDDIFEATKYTKALDNIKVLRKERAAELKVDDERLKFYKQDKEKAERMRKDLDEMIRKEESKQTEMEELKAEFERLQEQNQETVNQAHGFTAIFERVETLKSQMEMFEKNRKRMLENLTELDEPTDELNNMYSNFDSHLKTIQDKRDQQDRYRKKEDEAIDDLHRRERNLVSTQGGLQSNRRAYEQNIGKREAAVREYSRTHNIPGYDYSPLEENQINDFMEKLQDLVRTATTDLRRIKTEGARKKNELQTELDRLASFRTEAIANKQTKSAQISQLSAQIRQLETKFDSVSSVDADISVLENDVAVSEGRRERIDEEIQQARYDDQIREHNLTIRQKDADREKVNSELSLLNRQADSRAQLSIKRSELDSKTAQMNASVQSHASRFKDLVGSEINTETMEQTVTTAVGRKERELQDAESAASASNHTLSQLQTSVSIAKQNLRSKTEELARLQRQIADALEITDKPTVDEGMDECLSEIKIRTDEMNNKESMLQFYRKIQEVGQSKKKCVGCDRAIHANEKSAFDVYISTRIERCSAGNDEELKGELEQWEQALEDLRRAQPAVETVQKYKETEIPSLEKDIARDSAKLEQVQTEVENSRQAVQTAKLAARDLQTLKSAALIVSRTVNEIKDLKIDIQRLERDLKSSGSLKTVEEVQREADGISTEIKNLQRELREISSEKDLKTQTLNTLTNDISRKTVRLGELRSVQERRRMEEAALKEKQEQLTVMQGELRELEAKANSVNAPWNEQKDAMERYDADLDVSINDADIQVTTYQKSVGEVDGWHRQCTQYVTEGNDRKMRENEAHLEDVRREMAATKEGRAVIEGKIKSLEKDIASANNTRSNIKLNLDYRTEGSAIDEVKAKLANIDVNAAAANRRDFNTRYKAGMERENETRNRWQLASGVLLQMTENRKKLQGTLNTEYKTIDKEYRDQLVKTRMSKVANADLEKYGKALDNAILKYHSIKMDEINNTIGHLWNKTYQGTDIDNIRIVSAHDEQSTAARKSYNYRVVMVKNDVELDMRGRCSAGQKVLASIIIRLGLAESFGQGCGVLALDEPTTNLDQENINALAESLAEIIRERRRQTNFQLIVITHDEGFLQRLAAHDVLQYYWRVSRDASQKSTVGRERVGV